MKTPHPKRCVKRRAERKLYGIGGSDEAGGGEKNVFFVFQFSAADADDQGIQNPTDLFPAAAESGKIPSADRKVGHAAGRAALQEAGKAVALPFFSRPADGAEGE